MMELQKQVDSLLSWYQENKRPLPWRQSRDPYKIWISEIMLQQTTSKAVIPFFERFIRELPTVEDLAKAPQEKVYELWAGLGYYSRARNLQKAAKEIVKLGEFPDSFEELIKLPGLGPYTARSVASIAFHQPVGVVDGNTIRVFSRLYAEPWHWWTPAGRNSIQEIADHWASFADAAELNQALMELGASICRPKSPTCLLCPLQADCQANRQHAPEAYPSAKPKREREVWHWSPIVLQDQGKVLLVKDHSAPFLKNQWLLPGEAKLLKKKPLNYDFKHSITHHDIYVTLNTDSSQVDHLSRKPENALWVQKSKVNTVAPVSLIKKALSFV
ncbi:MAG: A/G-specific adenine glycosylase [Bdellovibrionales bacterium]|nr:A/G-specific adenine glycosylase [Bdellovibrionales bacterium]